MHFHRGAWRYGPFLLASIFLASCNYATDASGPTSGYDALVGTWSATTFVVSDLSSPGHDAMDLLMGDADGRPPCHVTITFRSDGSGQLDIVRQASDGPEPLVDDEFTASSVGQATLTLNVVGANPAEPIQVEEFYSERDERLTLRFTYPLDLDGDGQREDRLIVGSFRRLD